MEDQAPLFSPSSLCPDCPLLDRCGADLTRKACLDTWSPDQPGGPAVSHPLKPGTMVEIADLGGIGFEDIVAGPAPWIDLPLYTPQPRLRRAMYGYLGESVYVIKAGQAIRAKRVIPATEMRARLGLGAECRLVLLLFDRDELLERMWFRNAPLVWALREAAYDLIVSPSFSTYSPRARTEHLINLRRSMLYFAAMQLAGVPAIPRVGWEVEGDARRLGEWAAINPVVRMVGIDWQTHRSRPDWDDQLAGLRIFDKVSGSGLTYLICGLSTQTRCEQLFSVVPPWRVRITNATSQARIPRAKLRTAGDQSGRDFAALVAQRRAPVELAAANFASARATAA